LFIPILFLCAFSVVSGQVPTVDSTPGYQPLAPIPGFQEGSGDQALGQYINSLYQLSIGLGAVLAVLMIVVGGLQYMSTDAFSGKSAGRQRITQALMGLGLLLISFIILQTINPEYLDLGVDITATQQISGLDGLDPEGPTQEEVDAAAEYYARGGIAERDSVEQHQINLSDGYSVADGQKYCPRTQIAPSESEEEKEKKILNLEKRCNANLQVAQRERGDRRDYRGCQTLENPNGGYNIVQSCYYFKDK